jgi:hypothetical protein
VGGYQNTFVLAPKGQVSGCRYKIKLDGRVSDVQLDRLTYVRDVEFADGRDESPPIVRGWLYRGSDKSSNSWELIFGKEQNTRPGTYSIYYRFPRSANFTRWKGTGNVRRKAIDFDSQVSAILWANQIQVDQLALHPFDPKETSPLVPSLIWAAISPELNSFLKTRDASITPRLVKLQNGRLQYDLEFTPLKDGGQPVESLLFNVLQNTDDIELTTIRESRTVTVVASEVAPEFLVNGRVQLDRVAASMRNTMERDALTLASLSLGTSQKIADNSCEVMTGRWSLLSKGNSRSYFWKIKLKFDILSSNPEKYKISSLVDVGHCPTNEISLGENRITPLISDTLIVTV